MSRELVIGMVGSRLISGTGQREMETIASSVRSLGGWVRTGGAKGADEAARRGARERTIIYRPSKEPTDDSYFPAHIVYLDGDEVSDEVREEAFASVANLHWSPAGLSASSRSLLARNYLIVMGAMKYRRRAVDVLIFWAPESRDGEVLGGTGQAVRVAHANGIKTVNVNSPGGFDKAMAALEEARRG